VNATIRQQLANRKRRINRRLDKTKFGKVDCPVFTASKAHYEIAERSRGLAHGGIGAIHALARRLGLIDAIDARLHLLKIHLPYHESDHVLNLAYNALCEGERLQDIELRRNDEVFLDALAAQRIPDPTTAGDFCRRFQAADITTLQDIIHETRLKAWAEQPEEFFTRAIIDMDGTLVETTGQCKHGMDIAYDGTWGYHPLVLTLANSGEVLSLVNRSGNRPSHEGAAAEVDRCLAVCFRGGFRKVLLRGDTDFSQTEHLDRWDADPRVRFLFGYNATANLEEIAERLPEKAWKNWSGRCAMKLRGRRGGVRTTSRSTSSGSGSSRRCACVASRWRSSITAPRPAVRPTAWWWCARISPRRKASSACSTRPATFST